MHCYLWREVKSRTQALRPVVLFVHLHSWPRAFIPRSLYLKPWLENPSRCFCGDLLIRRRKRKTWRHFTPFWSRTQYFSTPSPAPLPSWPQSQEDSQSLLLEAPSTVRWCHPCWSPWPLTGVLFHGGEMQQGEVVFPLVSDSCLYHLSKWLEASLSLWACCFNQLHRRWAAQIFLPA